MPPNTCSDAKKTRKQKHQTGNHLRSNNDALYNLELLRLHMGRNSRNSRGRTVKKAAYFGSLSEPIEIPSGSEPGRRWRTHAISAKPNVQEVRLLRLRDHDSPNKDVLLFSAKWCMPAKGFPSTCRRKSESLERRSSPNRQRANDRRSCLSTPRGFPLFLDYRKDASDVAISHTLCRSADWDQTSGRSDISPAMNERAVTASFASRVFTGGCHAER